MKNNNFLLPLFLISTFLVLGNAFLYYTDNYETLCNYFGGCKEKKRSMPLDFHETKMIADDDNSLEIDTPVIAQENKHTVYEISSLEEYKEVLKNHERLVIEYYSPSCPACIIAKQNLETIANHFGSTLFFATIDISMHEGLVTYATEVGNFKEPLEVIPTFVYYNNSKVIEQTRGFKSATDFIETCKTIFALS